MPDPTEIDRWFADKDFTSDWTSRAFPDWCRIFESRRERTERILEIGSWQGRSAIFFLEFFRHASITCIDTFEGGTEHQGDPHLASIEQRFDRNLAPYGSRVTKIHSESIVALHALEKAGQSFDFAYIDGSHRRDDVIIDSLLTWRLATKGAIIVWDDYARIQPDTVSDGSVNLAVKVFTTLYADSIKIIDIGYQVVVEKRV